MAKERPEEDEFTLTIDKHESTLPAMKPIFCEPKLKSPLNGQIMKSARIGSQGRFGSPMSDQRSSGYTRPIRQYKAVPVPSTSQSSNTENFFANHRKSNFEAD